jgi:hypothetical protein
MCKDKDRDEKTSKEEVKKNKINERVSSFYCSQRVHCVSLQQQQQQQQHSHQIHFL